MGGGRLLTTPIPRVSLRATSTWAADGNASLLTEQQTSLSINRRSLIMVHAADFLYSQRLLPNQLHKTAADRSITPCISMSCQCRQCALFYRLLEILFYRYTCFVNMTKHKSQFSNTDRPISHFGCVAMLAIELCRLTIFLRHSLWIIICKILVKRYLTIIGVYRLFCVF